MISYQRQYLAQLLLCCPFNFLQGKVLTSNNTSGALCISQPWPGMARTIHNNHQRYIETYCQPYPGTVRCVQGQTCFFVRPQSLIPFVFVPTGYFFTGDGAYRSKEGYYQITGRLDDVINVSGHRIGTAEIEDVVVRSDFFRALLSTFINSRCSSRRSQ